ncbi:protein kinase domain-containing protein [Sorangium sp. So ce117]|uniref:protein kinase domain-containing protein n=1 Tax=Sorangium sp. So ce117 TaxID=3133277 RepID=UPI003F647744
MAVNVFISYAPADRSHLEALEAHLASLKRQGLVSTWHRGRIGPGAVRDESIAAELSSAEVVVLLVSEAFLASDSCYERELGRALERHRSGAARVVPILVRACDLEGTALSELQALPRNSVAVTSWANPDEAWRDVVRGIRAAVEEAAASARPEAALTGTTALPGAPGVSLREADETIRAVDKQIAAAQKRRVRLRAAGASTEEVDREIVDLRRKRREGGQLHVGEELSDGRYLLLERIGRGGFATVWRALDAGRGDLPVAIKVLHPNLAGDEGRRERFFRGARAMAELDHPGVVRILDPKGEDSGWHYFVMELVHGEDVQSAVVGKRLPAERVIPMLLSAGEAISFAHGRGLVHRDVKPANILLDGEGLPRITDFDLVWARDTTGGTRSGALGTFLYAAPELMHRPQDADARADVYGLGMTAVFCLHGGELPPIMMRYPGRVLERLPCSDAVRKVLERAIEFEASERFPDVAAFCEALRDAAADGGGTPLEVTSGVPVFQGERMSQTHEGSRRVAGGLVEAVGRDLEEGGPGHRAIEQEEIAFAGERWELRVPPASPVAGTHKTKLFPSLATSTIRFHVSRDERVRIDAVDGESIRQIEGQLTTFYALLLLARERRKDAAHGSLSEDEQGWIHVVDLAKQLGVDERHLNVLIHRARRAFANAGLGTEIVQRRQREIRIATGRVEEFKA